MSVASNWSRGRVLVATLLVGLLVAAGLLASEQPASARIGPIGDPYEMSLSSSAQAAILAGAAAVPGAIVCAYVTGGVCAVTVIAMGALSPVVVKEGSCPDGGTRKLLMQDFESEGNYGYTGNIYPVYYAEVQRSWCVPE